MKIKIILFLLFSISYQFAIAQNEEFQQIEFKKIAEGIDSPIRDLQIVCFNKFFNKDYLPKEFSEKYGLTDKDLFKKKMLVEIFLSDKENTGMDKVEIEKIMQGDDSIRIYYQTMNEDATNDNEKLAPFVVVQIPKSKKEIEFIKNGSDSARAEKTYVD